MKIAIISDIHANFAALEAFPEKDLDELWCLGDLVDYGPKPREVIRWVKDHAALAMRGNHDHAAGFGVDPKCSPAYRHLATETLRFTQDLCTGQDLDFLRGLPVQREIRRGGGRFYLVHAAPTDPLFGYRLEDSELWEREVRWVDADFLIVGHTHTPFVRKVGSCTIVNPGSIGQPKTGRPLACYALWQDGVVSLKEYPYPVQKTSRQIRQMPLAKQDQDELIAVLESGGASVPKGMNSQAISSSAAHSPLPAPDGGSPAPFRSILFADSEIASGIDEQKVSEIFSDLNLDQVVASITAGRDEYNLKPFFYTPLRDVETVNYRYDVFRDLEDKTLAEYFQSFAQGMRKMRAGLVQADKLYYKLQKQSWFLDAVQIYCEAASHLSYSLMHAKIVSRGLRAFRAYLAIHVDSGDFRALAAETQKLKSGLSGIRYSLHIAGKRVTVGKYNSEPDYSVDVLGTFRKFSQGTVKAYQFEYHSTPDMNHVEAAILDFVAKLYPEIFHSLDEYCTRYAAYLDSAIARFDREIQFYFAYLEHIQRLRLAGLPFCYPEVTDRSKEVYGLETFDLALAAKLNRERSPVVRNDFYLQDPERILVVSGPNQGGKTTFARTFGQLHYLGGIGCPVPGTEARLFLYDRLFTHFEREENIQNLSGKLEDELRRIYHILDCATPKSILIMNESFLATTLKDALFLGREMMRRIVKLDMLCVSVTFLDELASFGETTVSMVSSVEPQDPALRTFKLVRKPADGLAYAAAIAEKYRLTYNAVRARIAVNAKGAVTP